MASPDVVLRFRRIGRRRDFPDPCEFEIPRCFADAHIHGEATDVLAVHVIPKVQPAGVTEVRWPKYGRYKVGLVTYKYTDTANQIVLNVRDRSSQRLPGKPGWSLVVCGERFALPSALPDAST